MKIIYKSYHAKMNLKDIFLIIIKKKYNGND